jgi:hypothetical protein
MEWFSQKTSIAGIPISNWALVLGAIIIILLVYGQM